MLWKKGEYRQSIVLFFSILSYLLLSWVESIWSNIYASKVKCSLWQNLTSIYDKNSPESRNRRNIPQLNKSRIWQTHSKHYPQWQNIESISPKLRNKARVPTLTTTIQHSFGSFSQSNQSRKRNIRNPDRKRSKTLTVCRWHDPIHRKP